MRLFYHTLVLMLLAVLTFKVLAMQVVIDAAEEKAEKAMVIVALIQGSELEKPRPFSYKRYVAPPIDEEFPWMLEEPLPTEFPPPTDI